MNKCDRCWKEIKDYETTEIKLPYMTYTIGIDIATNTVRSSKEVAKPIGYNNIFALNKKNLCSDCMVKLAEFMEGDK